MQLKTAAPRITRETAKRKKEADWSSPPPSPSASETSLTKAEVTRESILRAGATIFSDVGYSEARLSDVAALVGMKAGSLYYHFDSRELLVEAILERGMQHTHTSLLQALSALPPDATPIDRLQAAIECHFMAIAEQQEFSRATVKLFPQIPEALRLRYLSRLRSYAKIWRKLLRDAKAAGQLRSDINLSIMRMTMVGALNSATEWFGPGSLTSRQVAREMSTLLLFGVASR